MATDPRAPSSSLLQFDHETVTLLVGAANEKFLLHRAHAKCSGFFAAAFKKEWDDGTQQISLPDDDPDLIRRYPHYLYTGKIACKSETADLSMDVADHEGETAMLAELYVLGEKLQDSSFKNTVIDAIIAKSGIGQPRREGSSLWVLAGTDVDTIYRGTCAGSPGRRLMVDFHTLHGNRKWITEEESLSREFLADLCVSLLDERTEESGRIWGWRIENCSYHEHEDGKICSTIPATQAPEAGQGW